MAPTATAIQKTNSLIKTKTQKAKVEESRKKKIEKTTVSTPAGPTPVPKTPKGSPNRENKVGPDSVKKSIKKPGKSGKIWKPKPAHSGVPLPEKFKRALKCSTVTASTQ